MEREVYKRQREKEERRQRLEAAGVVPDGGEVRLGRRMSELAGERVALWEGVDGR